MDTTADMSTTPYRRESLADQSGYMDSSPGFKKPALRVMNRNSAEHKTEFTNYLNSESKMSMIDRKRLTDGTSQRELERAQELYINRISPDAYNLPKLTGVRQIETNKGNSPLYSFRSRTKLTYFPGRDVDFAGSSSPPCTLYAT